MYDSVCMIVYVCTYQSEVSCQREHHVHFDGFLLLIILINGSVFKSFTQITQPNLESLKQKPRVTKCLLHNLL